MVAPAGPHGNVRGWRGGAQERLHLAAGSPLRTPNLPPKEVNGEGPFGASRTCPPLSNPKWAGLGSFPALLDRVGEQLRQRPELRRVVLHISSTRIATPSSQVNRILANSGDVAAACSELAASESTYYRLRPCAPGNGLIVSGIRWIAI